MGRARGSRDARRLARFAQRVAQPAGDLGVVDRTAMFEPPDDLPPEPGWTPLEPLGPRHGDRSFVRNDGSDDRIQFSTR